MRFIVLFLILVCMGSVAKVALLRWREKPPVPQARSAWEADGRLRAYPTAKLSPWKGLVYSPYLAETLLDVKAFQPGDLVRCGGSDRAFYVPLRHDFAYGEIVGEWRIRCAEFGGDTEYHLRFLPERDGVSAKGHRIKEQGRLLSPSQRTSLALRGFFKGDQLTCDFEETLAGGEVLPGRFSWSFSSAQDLLQGTVESAAGVIVSEGKRVAGSRGQVPASGQAADDLVPEGWRLLDSVTGPLATRPSTASQDRFMALVAEENGELPLRWLIVAHRESGQRDFQTLLITPHACRTSPVGSAQDTFVGLCLPQQAPLPGVFGLRHHSAQDYTHEGLDLWFRHDPVAREWRLSEGKRYGFDLAGSSSAPQWSPVIPGTPLLGFKIEQLRFQRPDSPPAAPSSPGLTANVR